MASDLLFEIAVIVFVFLVLGIVLTIYEFKYFISPEDQSVEKEPSKSKPQ